MGDTIIGRLLCWELQEISGQWQAWVSWVKQSSGSPQHLVVTVQADTVTPLEPAESYEAVPRRVRGRDGVIRPWSGEIG